MKNLAPRDKTKKTAVETGGAARVRVIADDVKQRLSRGQERYRELRVGNFSLGVPS
jgi:hypothetical protein